MADTSKVLYSTTSVSCPSYPNVDVSVQASVTGSGATVDGQAVASRGGRVFVVAIDGSRIGDSALGLALSLARSKDGIVVVSVERSKKKSGKSGKPSHLTPKRILSSAEPTLAVHGADYQLVHVKVGAKSGKSAASNEQIAAGILSVADAVSAEFIIMGSRGLATSVFSRETMQELGSVASSVLSKAAQAVVVVKNEATDTSAEDSVIAVAVDGSDVSLRAVMLAHAMAERIKAQLHVCSIVSLTYTEEDFCESVADALGVDNTPEAFADANVDLSVLSRTGSVGQSLVSHLEPLRPLATVICTSTHFRASGGLGSTSSWVVRKAMFNIILIKPSNDE